MIESAEEFLTLRRSENPAEYRRAAHDAAPLEVWLTIIATYPEMRCWVAHNKTVPIEVLGKLAHDPDEHVRWMVATKRKLTRELFDLLAADRNETVRARIALNRNAPQAVVERLAGDESVVVRSAACEQLERRSGGPGSLSEGSGE